MSEQPAAGWFPDPSSPGNLRWWDGTAWSSHVAPGGGDPGGSAQTASAQASAYDQAAAQQAAAQHAAAQHALQQQAAQQQAQYAQHQHATNQVHAPLAQAQAQAPHVVGGGPQGPHAGGEYGIQQQNQQPRGAIAFDAGSSGGSFPGSALLSKGGLVAKIVGGVVAAVVALTLTAAFDSTADIKLDHTFSTPDKKMSVAMPGKPKHEQKTEAVEDFQLKADLYTYEFSRDRGGIVVGAVDYDQLFTQLPKDQRSAVRALMTPKTVLDSAAEGAAAEGGGTIESKTSTTVSGHPAMELKIRPGDGEGVAEGVMVYVQKDAALYMVVIVTRDGDKELLAKAKQSIRIQA